MHGGPLSLENALVLGAGGTARAACYALKNMGVVNLYVYNRTLSKAEALAGTGCGVCARFGRGRVMQHVDYICSLVLADNRYLAIPLFVS